MKTVEFNLNNWTGETTSIEYSIFGEFEMYDYNWKLCAEVGNKEDGYKRTLMDLDSGDTHMIYIDAADIEKGVIAAARWIANNI